MTEMTIQHEFLYNWAKILGKNSYVQFKGRLRDENSYCALGVACDLYDPEAWKEVGLSGIFEWHENIIRIKQSDIRTAMGFGDFISAELVSILNDKGFSFSNISKIVLHCLKENHPLRVINKDYKQFICPNCNFVEESHNVWRK